MTENLENVIDRLEKMVIYIEELDQKKHIEQYPRLFSSYLIVKLNEEINNLKFCNERSANK